MSMNPQREPHGVCPVHGAYFDNYAWREEDRKCERCRKDAEQRIAPLTDAYDRAKRRWEGWLQVIPPRHANRTLANWTPEGRGQEAAKAMVKRYVDSMPERVKDGRGLVLMGPPGVGKTHLLCAIVSACWAQGIRADYHVWPQVLTAVKDSFGAERDHPGRGLLDQLAGARVLVLDELAVRAGTEYDQTALFEVLDHRYQALLPTICATNATDKTLHMIGERAVDRMKENMHFLHINGASRREQAGKDKALQAAAPALVEPEPVSMDYEICVNGQMEKRTWVYPNNGLRG